MLIFGAFQIILSQIPNLDELWLVSTVAALVSFAYSSIGLGLAIGKTTGTDPLQPHSHKTAEGWLSRHRACLQWPVARQQMQLLLAAAQQPVSHIIL